MKDLADIKPGCRSSNPQKNMRHLRINPEMELEKYELDKWIGTSVLDQRFSHFRFHKVLGISGQESSPPSPLESEFKKAGF